MNPPSGKLGVVGEERLRLSPPSLSVQLAREHAHPAGFVVIEHRGQAKGTTYDLHPQPKERLRERARSGRFVTFLPWLAVGLAAPAQELPHTAIGSDPDAGDSQRRSVEEPTTSESLSWIPSSEYGLMVPPPSPGLGTSVLPMLGESGLPAARPLATSPEAAAAARTLPLQWGKFSVQPHLGYGLVYGTGILSGPGQDQATMRQTLSPGLRLNFGPRWSLDYTPSLQFYSNSAYQDTLDHDLSLSGSAVSPGWLFTLGYGFNSSSPPLAETGAQTAQDTHGLTLGANHTLDARTTLQLGLAQYIRLAESYTDSYTWSTSDWLDYEWDARFATAIGMELAYDLLDPGTDMTSERLLGRVRGEAGTKLRYSLAGGVEWREFRDSDAPTKLSPTVEGSLTYQLFETTSISLLASHMTGASYFSDQFTETTNLGGGLRQRLLGRLSLSLGGGYRIQDYASTLTVDSNVRRDEGAYFQSSLGAVLLKRVNASVFYRYSENGSDQTGYSYDSNQIGLQLSAGL